MFDQFSGASLLGRGNLKRTLIEQNNILLLMEEIRWSPVDMVVYPIVYRVSYMSGGAGSLPSTVSPSSSIQDSCSNHQKDPQPPGIQSPLLKWKLYHLWSFLSILESLIYVPCSKVVVCGMAIRLSIAILASWLIWADVPAHMKQQETMTTQINYLPMQCTCILCLFPFL